MISYKKNLFIFLLVSSITIDSNAKDKLFPMPLSQCQGKVEQQLRDWQSTSDWQQLISTDPWTQRFASPSRNFGTWIYLETNAKGVVQILAKHSQETMQAIKFFPDCSTKQKYDRRPFRSRNIGDKQLEKIFKKNKEMLLYVWSPGTTYAIPSFRQIQKLKRKAKMPIKVLLSHRASTSVAKQILKKTKLPKTYLKKVQSFDLRMRGIGAHIPMLYYVKKGKIKGTAMAGYKSVNEYLSIISKRKSLR